MIIYEQRRFEDVYETLMPMFHEHWDELGHKGGFNDLVLDIPKYLYLERTKALLVTVAVLDGVMIGYTNSVLGSFNHNANETIATMDAMYVTKKHRNTMSGVGYRLLKFTEKLLQVDFNTKAINFAVNVNYDISEFLTRTGYVHSETTYIKKLGE